FCSSRRRHTRFSRDWSSDVVLFRSKELVLDLSLQREEALQMANNQDVLIKQLDERRQEISGVSLDEEMANMIKYQHSYVANSRVINAIDEMLDRIINGIGVTR